MGGVSDFLRLGEEVPQKKVLGWGRKDHRAPLTVRRDGSEKQEFLRTRARVLWCCFYGWWKQSGTWGRHGD